MPARKRLDGTSDDYLTVGQVAEALHISRDTVMRRFDGEGGVLDIGRAETDGKRRYRLLRIPLSALARYIRNHSA